MPLLTMTNLKHSYGSQRVLEGVTLSIEAGEKIGLVGRNGSGKSTLMRIMAELMQPDSGSIHRQRGLQVGYLDQDPSFEDARTVRDVALTAFTELHQTQQELNDLYEQMQHAEQGQLEQLMRKQASLEARMEAAGGYAIDHVIDGTLHGLGFGEDQFQVDVDVLSGGQKARLGLARLLLRSPGMLLLDEPTNHLDIEGRRWLERFLSETYTGALVVVSHDRWLLDQVVHRIIDVEHGHVREYPGNYRKYLELRKERQQTQQRQHDKQLDRIRSEEQFIAKYKAGQRAKQARGRQSRLERFKSEVLVDRPAELDVMNLQLPRPPRVGDVVVTAEQIGKSFQELTLFSDFSISIAPGDRIGVIGPNGIGKTTLIRTLIGQLEPDQGSIRNSPRLSIGYFRQTQEHLDLDLTVWQYLQSVIVSLDGAARASEQQARDLAGAFLFSGEQQDKTLQEVSGGERARAVIAGLIARAHNLIVLDEPTNHLDIPSAERLEQAVVNFSRDGALLLITHDRALLDATCNQLLVFEAPGRIRHYHGNYSQYLEQLESEAAEHEPRPRKKPRNSGRRKAKSTSSEADSLERLSTKKLEQSIETLEEKIAHIDSQMLQPEVYSDHEQCRQLQEEKVRLQEELEPLEFEWTRRADQVD